MMGLPAEVTVLWSRTLRTCGKSRFSKQVEDLDSSNMVCHGVSWCLLYTQNLCMRDPGATVVRVVLVRYQIGRID